MHLPRSFAPDNFIQMISNVTAPTMIRRAGVADAALLARVGAQAFVDTFGADNTPDDMASYLAGAFGESIQRAELADARNTLFLAERRDDVVGYAMLREGPAPSEIASDDAIEIVRLYAFTKWIGTGVGAALMRHCLGEAAARGRQVVWLGVWERNARAIAFYQRWGFADVGSHAFLLGSDRQTDRLMARAANLER